MSVRCVSVQNLRTVPNALFDGSSGVSVSFWVMLNQGSGVVPADANVFGRPGDNLFGAVVVRGTGAVLRVYWLADGTGSAPLSSYDVPLSPGTGVHIAATYQQGSQRYYVNGVLVSSDTCPSALSARAGAATSAPFQVGPGVAGLDVTVCEPTVWQGYQLSAADVVNLRDRVVHPEGVAQNKIVWQLSLAGAAGASVTASDAGLADKGPNRLNAVAVTNPPPTYVAGVLLYDPAVRLSSAMVCTSGTSIVLAFVDRTGSPAPVTYLSNNSVQYLTTNAVTGTMTLSFGGQTTAPIPIRTTPDVIQAALEALPTVGVGNVTVTGFGPYTIELTGSLGGSSQPLLTVTPTGLLSSLQVVGTTLGTSTAQVNTGDAGFTRNGGGWGAGFISQGTNWYKLANPGTGKNSAKWAVTLPAAGLYSVSVPPVDTSLNPDVGTVVRYRLFDGTTYRGTVTVNPRFDGTHDLVRVATVYVASGTLNVYTADDADMGGALYAGYLAVGTAATLMDSPVPASWPLGGSARTFAVRFKVGSLGTDKCLLHYGSYFGSGCESLFVTAAGKIAYKNAGIAPIVGTTTLTAGGTYLLTYAVDAATGIASLYLNGALEVTGQASPNTDASGTFKGAAIGMPVQGDTLANWDSTIDRIGVWGRNLSASEVSSLYNGGSVPTYSSLPGTLTTGVVSYYDIAAASPGLDAVTGNAQFTPLYGQTPSESYGRPGVAVTSTRTGGPLPITVNGGTAVALNSTPIWSNSPSSFYQRDWLIFTTTGKIKPGDVVTISIDSGVIGTTAGPLGAVTNLVVTNNAGSPLLPQTLPAPRSLKVGYNVSVQSWFLGLQVYSNLMMGSSEWLGANRRLPVDSGGYPNASFAAIAPEIKKWCSYSNPFGPDPRGEPLQPFGNYTLLWDGTEPGLTLAGYPRPGGILAPGQTAICDQVSYTFNNGANNKRVLNFAQGRELNYTGTNPPLYDPHILIVYPSNPTFKSATNIRVYPPNIDASKPPKFNPAALALLSGSKVFRTMTWFGTNAATYCDYSDFLTDGEIPGAHRDRVIGIALFEPFRYSPSSIYSHPPDSSYTGILLKVTTTAPHGLRTGSTSGFWHADGITPYFHYDSTAPGFNGNTFSAYLQAGAGTIYVLNATQFILSTNCADFTAFTPPDMVFIAHTSTFSFVDACLFCNAIGSDCTFWHNVAHGATDACIVKQAQDAAATLTAGKEVLIEYSNEPWNFSPAFTQFQFMITMGRDAAKLTATSTPPNPLTPMGFGPRALNAAEFYVLRSAQVRKVFQDAWNAAGRTEPVRLVLNAQVGNASMVQGYLDYARDHDYLGNDVHANGYNGSGPIRLAGDGICVAPYFDIAPRTYLGDPSSSKLPDALIDGLTLEQFEDVADANFRWPARNAWYYGPKAQLAAVRAHNHPDAALIHLDHYEGGPGYCGLKDASPQQQINSMAHPLHPRSYFQFLAYLKSMDDNGGRYFAQFGYSYGYGPEGTGSGGPNTLIPNYTTWYGINWDGVKGDGSDHKANNLLVLTDATGKAKTPALDAVGSVRGLSIRDWNAALSLPAGTTGPIRRIIPGRSGIPSSRTPFRRFR